MTDRLLALCPSWDLVVRIFCVLAALGICAIIGAVLGICVFHSAIAPIEEAHDGE